VLAIAIEACRGLAFAHAFIDERGAHRPIIHRDISPANVMICRDGAVKLLDFGVASCTHGETLSIDTFAGKLAYMSPEQLERRVVDRRADVFAFGALLHELLVGQRLFHATSDRETIRRIRELTIDPPSAHNREVGAALDVVVLTALARDPEARYDSAVELLHALEALPQPAASRGTVLTHLGRVVPEIFASSCESCGARVLYGADCHVCRTVVESIDELDLDEPVEPPDCFMAPAGSQLPPAVASLRKPALRGHLRNHMRTLAAAVTRGWGRLRGARVDSPT
jgi:serine/threonine protein kinase